MSLETETRPNVKQTVPLLVVSNMEASLRCYVDGLGFEMTNKWIDGGRLRWCWLEIGGAALMLQERHDSWAPEGKVGVGVSIWFTCGDALRIYREALARGIEVRRPFVGNGMWDVALSDPDGYNLHFESPTDVPEGTEYSAEP